MNPEPTDRQDAGALDAFWDELVLSQFSGTAPNMATSPNEEMVMNLQSLVSPQDDGAENRLRRLVFGSTPEPTLVTGPIRPMPAPRPEPIRPTWSIRKYSQLAAAALAVLLVGAMVAALSGGFFGWRRNNDSPTAIPAAIAQIEATPAALASPIVANNGIVWSLPFEGANVEIGASALADGALYRLIRSDQFTGVQAVDTATGTEKWRSEQEWSGSSLAAGANDVAFLTAAGVVGLDPARGDARWSINSLDITPVALAQGENTVYVWDGNSIMTALETGTGSITWQTDAGLPMPDGTSPATQAPVVTASGIAAISAGGLVALFDTDGNATGTIGQFEPESVALAGTQDGTVVFAGVVEQDHLPTPQPWAHKLTAANPADGSLLWQADYNALVTGLTVTDSMALVLSDNPGMTTANPYPEQTSPHIYGYFIDTGQILQEPEDPTAWNAHGKTWIADPGNPPFVALAEGVVGPIGISASGRMSFFGTGNPLVQAVVDLPGLLSSRLQSDASNSYVSQADGALVAVAPVLANRQPQPLTQAGTIDWTIPLAEPLVDFGGMSYGNGLVFRLIETSPGRQIEATYAATGQSAWTLPFDWSTDQIIADPGPNRHEQNPTWTGSGNVFAVDANNRLIALSSTGASSWHVAFGQPVVSMVFDTGTLFVWDESGTMTALNATDGAVQWTTSSNSAGGSQTNAHGMPVPVTTKTLVAMVDAQGTLHGYDRATGAERWSQTGFDGTNSRLVVSGEGLDGPEQWIVILSARGEPDADGNFELTASGILAETGEYRWDDYLQGPLVQPVTSDEAFVTFVANQAMAGKAVTVTITPVVDAESPSHYLWTASGSSDESSAPGGQRLFAIDAPTGQIVWIRTSPGSDFTGLVADQIFRRGQALTADGLLVSPSSGSGWIDGEPLDLGGPVLSTASSGELSAIGSFATLADGTLVAFGGTPFSQQG